MPARPPELCARSLRPAGRGATSWSTVAPYRVVHGAIERLPHDPAGLAVENDARLLGPRARAVAGVCEASALLDQRLELGPALRGPALVEREPAQLLAVGLCGGAQRRDQRQRDLALGQVVPDRLAGGAGVALVVEQVVHDLEPHP